LVDPKLIAPANAPQIRLSATELNRLANRVQSDFRSDIADHQVRMARFTRYYRRWRNLTDPPALGEEARSNYNVPITQWQTSSKLAKEMSSLLGDDAEIVAKPIGPSDRRRNKLVSRFMTWQVFDSMKLPNKIYEFAFRKILFGRSHAYAPWQRDTYMVPLRDGTFDEEVDYEGPGFDPLWPDDLMVPAEDARTIHDFSHVIRKYRASADDMLRGEEHGLYQSIEENYQALIDFQSTRRHRDSYSEDLKLQKDLAEGVSYEGSLSGSNTLPVYEWYGKWRELKGKKDARENNLDGRRRYESDLVVRYQPDLNLIIGVQDLALMYPRMKDRRPFVESSLMRDGSYWGPSFGEMLEDIETELSANHNLLTEAGEMCVGPVIFYRPASGFDPQTAEWGPKSAIPTEDPAGVNAVQIRPDLSYASVKEQSLSGYGERVTGITDMQLGRTQDRPNAPRTARQTMALLSEGDVRAELDTGVLREDFGLILSRFWLLNTMFMPEKQFFRVTEDDAAGLFDIKNGGAYMTSEEMGGRYDFDIKFATNVWSKAQNKENELQLYGLDLQNPLVAQNPRALWEVLDRVHKAFGDEGFCDIVPRPPDPGLPLEPKEEWTRVLQGEDLAVNPADDDAAHILRHNRDIQSERITNGRDDEAINAMVDHVQQHVEQVHHKRMMQMMAQEIAQSIQQHTGLGQGMLSNGNALSNIGGAVQQMLAGQQGQQPQPGGQQ
jgi:hypothetical protein